MRASIFLIGLFFSIITQAQEKCPDKRQFIFLVHGVGGNKNSFGHMEKYLRKTLNKNNSCHQIYSFEYPTGDSRFNTKYFAHLLGQFILKKTNVHSLEANDKISLIMHSQGGLVGQLFLRQVQTAPPQSRLYQLHNMFDSFITLGTPYWGADTANIGRRVLFPLPFQRKNPVSPFGKKELNDMSYASDIILELKNNFEQIFHSDLGIRPLAIAGHTWRHGIHLGEDDNMVPIYSARADHFRATSIRPHYDEDEITSYHHFVKTKRVPFILVPASHSKSEWPGIANIPRRCLKQKTCKHPSMPAILAHLKGQKTRPFHSKKKLTKFRLNFFVHIPIDLRLNDEDLTIELLNDPRNVKLPFLKQFLPQLQGIAKTSRKGLLRSSFEGRINRHGSPMVLKFRVSASQLKPRIIEAVVQEGHHTFIEINLLKNSP